MPNVRMTCEKWLEKFKSSVQYDDSLIPKSDRFHLANYDSFLVQMNDWLLSRFGSMLTICCSPYVNMFTTYVATSSFFKHSSKRVPIAIEQIAFIK